MYFGSFHLCSSSNEERYVKERERACLHYCIRRSIATLCLVLVLYLTFKRKERTSVIPT